MRRSIEDLLAAILEREAEMGRAAEALEFEQAARRRDEVNRLKQMLPGARVAGPAAGAARRLATARTEERRVAGRGHITIVTRLADPGDPTGRAIVDFIHLQDARGSRTSAC